LRWNYEYPRKLIKITEIQGNVKKRRQSPTGRFFPNAYDPLADFDATGDV
jgi:hypothetical protein